MKAGQFLEQIALNCAYDFHGLLDTAIDKELHYYKASGGAEIGRGHTIGLSIGAHTSSTSFLHHSSPLHERRGLAGPHGLSHETPASIRLPGKVLGVAL